MRATHEPNRPTAPQSNREIDNPLHCTLDALTDGFWDWDLRSGDVFFSDGLIALLGFSRNEVLPLRSTWEQWLHPEDRKRAIANLTALQSANPPESIRSEYRLRTRTGEWKWILDRGRISQHANDGTPQRAIGSLTLIDRESLESTEKAMLEERLRLAVDASQLGIWDVDLLTGNVAWNDRMFDLYGLSNAPLIEQLEDWLDRIHPEDAPRVAAMFSPAPLALDRDLLAEFRILTPTGETRWIRSLGRLLKNSKNQWSRALGVNLDETVSRRLEQEVEKNRNDLRKAELLARVGNWSLDFKNDVVVWSEGLRDLFQIEATESPPSLADHGRILVPASLETLQEAIRNCTQQGTPYDIELEAIRADGTHFFLNAKGNAARNAHGEITELYGTAQDITLQKQAEHKIQQANEELRQANAKLHAALTNSEILSRHAQMVDQQRSSLLAVMSHEIRTPLNAILGMASLLETTSLDAEQNEYVETLSSSGQSLAVLLNDILDFSKLEAGKITLERKPFSLLHLVHEALIMFAGAAREKGVELAYSVAPDFSDHVRGDFFRLKQVLINLLGNALKFTDQGGIMLRLETTLNDEQQIILQAQIQDTGIGISKRALENLFQPFQQADSSITRKFGGTGLGLAITEQLVNLMKGQIRVESEINQGSLFEFTVSLEAGQRPLQAPALAPGFKVGYLTRSGRQREMIRSLVQCLGGKFLAISHRAEVLADSPEVFLIDTPLLSSEGAEIPAVGKLVEVHCLGEKTHSDYPKLTIPCSIRQLEECLKTSLPDKKTAAAPVEKSSLRILVAEDNKVNQRVILLMLNKLGLSADLVANGAEALRELSAQNYDLVLMDLQMPDVDGITATHLWRVSEMRTGGRVYICALTANATENDRQRCLEVGMDDYLSKPVVLSRLKEMFDRARDILAKRQAGL